MDYTHYTSYADSPRYEIICFLIIIYSRLDSWCYDFSQGRVQQLPMFLPTRLRTPNFYGRNYIHIIRCAERSIWMVSNPFHFVMFYGEIHDRSSTLIILFQGSARRRSPDCIQCGRRWSFCWLRSLDPRVWCKLISVTRFQFDVLIGTMPCSDSFSRNLHGKGRLQERWSTERWVHRL